MAFTEDEMAMTREQRIESVVEVAQIVCSIMSKGFDQESRDNNLSRAYFGVITAVDKYDPEKGTSLRNFAFDKARFEVMNGWRVNSRISRKDYTLLKAAEKNDGPLPVICTTVPLDNEVVDIALANSEDKPTEDEAIENLNNSHAANVLDCEKVLNGLTPELAFVLRRRFLDGASHLEIGKELGISDSRSCQLVRKALKEALQILAAV